MSFFEISSFLCCQSYYSHRCKAENASHLHCIFMLLQLTVTLTDINDNAPRFDISEYVGGRAFREDATPGTLIATGMVLSHTCM